MFFYTLLLVFLTRFRSPPGFLPKAVFIISNFDIAQRYLHDICTHFSSGGNSQGAATILSTAILLTFIFFFIVIELLPPLSFEILQFHIITHSTCSSLLYSLCAGAVLCCAALSRFFSPVVEHGTPLAPSALCFSFFPMHDERVLKFESKADAFKYTSFVKLHKYVNLFVCISFC